MEPKTVIFAIVLLGVLTSTTATTNMSTTAAPDAPTTIPDTTTTTPNITTATPIPVTSTPETEPTQTTPNDTTMGTTNATETSPTTPEPTTTPKPTTTPPPPEVGTWTVVEGEKNLTCMKMTFKGTISKKNLDPMLIPTTAAADSSTCGDEQADFVLQFEDANMTSISITLSFVMQDKTTSYLWSSSISYNQTTETKVQILFETPIGKSYQCNKQIIPISDTFNVTLEELRLQPFASFANHDFGDAYSCEPPTSSGPNAAVVVGLVLGAIIFVLLIAVVILYRKKKSPGRGYAHFS